MKFNLILSIPMSIVLGIIISMIIGITLFPNILVFPLPAIVTWSYIIHPLCQYKFNFKNAYKNFFVRFLVGHLIGIILAYLAFIGRTSS